MSDNAARPSNAVSPTVVPRRAAPKPMAVEARLVWPEREEWAAGVATRWTKTHVLVELPARGALTVWLAAEDVHRS